MVRSLSFFIVLSLLLPFVAAAETVVSAEVSYSTAAVAGKEGVDTDDELTTLNSRLVVNTGRSDTVKGKIAISLTGTGILTLEQAWIRARFPWIREGESLRLSAGKMPLSWGKGFFLNAGDLIFGELPPVSSLSDGEYRTATETMATLQVPFGAFSFAEGVWIRGGAGGGRLVLTPSWRFLESIEGGYLYADRGENANKHDFALSAQGSVFFDWHMNASTDEKGEKISVSGGVFRVFMLGNNLPLTVRVESLSHPRDKSVLTFALASIGVTDNASIGIQALYASGDKPVWVLLNNGDGLLSLNASWQPLKGFSLGTSVSKLFRQDERWTEGYIIQAGCTLSY